VTSYHSLQDCFFERLPEPLESDNANSLLETYNATVESASLSDEQVSLLALDQRTELDNPEFIT